MSEPEDSVLGIDSGAPERLTLHVYQVVQIIYKILSSRTNLVYDRIRCLGNEVYVRLFTNSLIFSYEAEGMQLQVFAHQMSHCTDD